MIVTCPRCLTKFNFTEETQVFAAEINFRCSRCQEEFVFTPDNDAGAFSEVMASLSEREAVEEPVARAGNHDMSAGVDEIELVEDFASFISDSFAEPEPDVELALDDNELFPAAADNLDGGTPAEAASGTASDTPDEFETEELVLDLDSIDLGGIKSGGDDDSGSAPDNQAAEQPEDAPAESAAEIDDAAAESVTEVQTEPAEVTEDNSGADQPKHSFLLFFGAIIILGLALWFGFSMWQQYALDMGKQLQLVEVSTQRLYPAPGREVIILTGKVVNHSPKLVTDLKIKGVLVDGSGRSVAEVVTAGGVIFSPDELSLMDSRKLAARRKNEVNLMPDGGVIPFMVVFYECPAAADKCYAEISSFKIK